jgi:hypothetical protein
LKEYPPSRDAKVREARGKFFDLRVEIRDRCQRIGCAYQEPKVAPGLTEATEPKATEPVSTKEPAKGEPQKSEKPALDPVKHPEFIEKPSAKWPVVITTGALGVVGLGLGVGFHVLAEDKKGEALGFGNALVEDDIGCERSTPRRCAEYEDAKQSFYDMRTAETISLIAGGTLATAAVVMAIVWPDKGRPSAAVNARPLVAVSGKDFFLGFGGQF